jgi:branched-chain amino acid transport system ATP-binding protein
LDDDNGKQGRGGLVIEGLRVRYGATDILRGLGLQVQPGEVACLLGNNGCGKSTALNTISGFVRPYAGSVLLDGTELAGCAPHQTFRNGVCQVSQRRDLFPDMSVEDNLRLGAALRGRRGEEAALQRVMTLFPRLAERRRQKARTMSGGEQQMVAIGRALMSSPRLLLLDEPSGGLAPQVLDEIAQALRQLKREGLTMLMVEQNIGLASAVSDRFYIIRDGIVGDTGAMRQGKADQAELAKRIYL